MTIGREVLLIQAIIEVVEHHMGINKGLQPRAFEQDGSVALPALTTDQILIQGTIFIGVLQIQGPRLDRALGMEKQEGFIQRDPKPPVLCDGRAFLEQQERQRGMLINGPVLVLEILEGIQ